jgi:hypothetical protein
VARVKTVLGHWQVGPAHLNFSWILNLLQILKFEIEAIPLSKNCQTLQGDRFEHEEQLSDLAQQQNPSGFSIINSGINSNLNVPWILKGFKPFGKKLVNSLKFYLEVIFMNVNLVGHTFMQELKVSIQVSSWLGLEIKERFEMEIRIKPSLYSIKSL